MGWALTEAEHDIQANVLGGGEDWVRRVATGLPLRRLFLPAEAARLAVYLMSDASAPMTGVSLDLEQTVVGAPR